MRPVNSKYPVTLGYRQKANFDPNYIHRGIDYGCPSGTSVVATVGGLVVYAADARRSSSGSYGPAYGIHVIVKVNSTYCLYAHLSKTLVTRGQSVVAGQELGKSGATGNVRGAHLHYQECTKPPGAYTSDRAPQFIDSPPRTKPPIHPIEKNDYWVVDTETLHGRDYPHTDYGTIVVDRNRGTRIDTTEEVSSDGLIWNYQSEENVWYCQSFLKRTHAEKNVEKKQYLVLATKVYLFFGPGQSSLNKSLAKDDVFTSTGWEEVNGVKWVVNSKYEWASTEHLSEIVKKPVQPSQPGYYPEADIKTQNFTSKYLGDKMKTNCVVLHSTEGTSWPSYQNGSTAPHVTVYPDFENKKVRVRQHFAADRSARSLEHRYGTVETNTLNVFQIEMVGTCDPQLHAKWKEQHIYMPEASQWFIDGVADILVWLKKEFPAFEIENGAPRGWAPYPKNIQSNYYRMSTREWINFRGVAGHAHVPNQSHGDPGNFPINKLLTAVERKMI